MEKLIKESRNIFVNEPIVIILERFNIDEVVTINSIYDHTDINIQRVVRVCNQVPIYNMFEKILKYLKVEILENT